MIRRSASRSGPAQRLTGPPFDGGTRMTHCHNLYHAPEGGMMAVLGYQT